MLEEQPSVVVNTSRLNLVEDEYVCSFYQLWGTERFPIAQLRTTGEEEFDLWDLGYNLSRGG